MSHFTQHYATLHDEELIHIALSRSLSEEAEVALKAELSKRGLTDLSSHAKFIEQEQLAEREFRDEEIARKKKRNIRATQFVLLISALMCIYDIYRLTGPKSLSSAYDAGIFLVMGVVLALYALARMWATNLWSKHVLHRTPPT